MTVHRCGRIDDHEPHQWSVREPYKPPTTYSCTGYVLTEGAQRRWDDEDDAAEEQAIRDRREAM